MGDHTTLNGGSSPGTAGTEQSFVKLRTGSLSIGVVTIKHHKLYAWPPQRISTPRTVPPERGSCNDHGSQLLLSSRMIAVVDDLDSCQTTEPAFIIAGSVVLWLIFRFTPHPRQDVRASDPIRSRTSTLIKNETANCFYDSTDTRTPSFTEAKSAVPLRRSLNYVCLLRHLASLLINLSTVTSLQVHTLMLSSTCLSLPASSHFPCMVTCRRC